MGGTKHDKGKPRLEMLPPSYWMEIDSSLSFDLAVWYFYKRETSFIIDWDPVPVLEFGRKKYNAHNWHKGMRWGRLVGAFHRHCNRQSDSGLLVPRALFEKDDESGLPHGQHASCCLLFLGEYYQQFTEENNIIGENDCPWYVNKEQNESTKLQNPEENIQSSE